MKVVFFDIIKEKNKGVKNLKYDEYNINFIREQILSEEIVIKARKNEKDFTRNRKLTVKDLILYNLNKRGFTTKMELENFISLCNKEDISSPALLKQREKLNEEIFKYLNEESMKNFYTKFSKEVKTFKGYVVTVIDGSDCEIPNTPFTRKKYKAQKASKADKDRCARIKLSNCYDILNNYILDTQIEQNRYDELELAQRHLKNVKEIILNYNIIRIMDRGYISLKDIYYSIKKDDKFVVRLKKAYFKNEQRKMRTNDEIVEIEYQYDRVKYYKKVDNELYEYYENGNTIKVRFVNIILPTGEVETILTNLNTKEFTTEDINYLYQLRWGIETSYHYLKESMKITNISSSKDGIIKQEIYSQMLVFNMLQAIQNEKEKEINQEKYKHKMKININMAVGYIKRYIIVIMLEDDMEKRKRLYDELTNKILKNIVPIRKGRTFDRNKNTKNRYHLNKRKSF